MGGSSRAPEKKDKQSTTTAFLNVFKRTAESVENKDLTYGKDQTYSFKKQLGGRGQAEVAGFYENKTSKQDVLIKQDKYVTCVMEGSGGFVKALLPKQHETAINLAACQRVRDNKGREIVVTIQPQVTDAQPLDEILLGLGRKRDPHTIRSEESANLDKLQENLSKLTPKAKAALATGIFASSVAGDESIDLAPTSRTPH